jgi:putative hemolysin
MFLFLTVVFVTLLLSAVCSLFEATLFSTRVASLEAAKAQGRNVRKADAFLAMKQDISVPTSAILILNTVANTAGATMAGMLAAQLFGSGAVPIFSIALTFAILMFSEILPKTYGAVHWRHLWSVIVWPLLLVQRVLRPFVWLTEKFSSFITHGQTVDPTTEDEILAMIQLGAKTGHVSATELELLTAVFQFDEARVREVMVPRHEIHFLDVEWPLERCLEAIESGKHTRYPLCRGSLEDVIGVINLKDLVLYRELGALDLEAMARPIVSVPDTMPIRKVLRQMQRSQQHLSLVIDELGSVVGAVTLENVLEQLVGSVQDEFDSEEPQLISEEPGSFIASERLLLAQLNNQLDLRLVEPGVHTLSGLLAARLGRLPRVGDKMRIDEIEAEVLEVHRNRASRVRIIVVDEDEATATAAILDEGPAPPTI